MNHPTPSGGVPDGAQIPAMLAARPRDTRRGLPIPPVNEHPDPSGGWHVDFTTINTTIATRLAAERRCSLCGDPDGLPGGVSWAGPGRPIPCSTPTRPGTPSA